MIPNCKQAKYSTKEQKIGTWIDGKKIYRKTFKFQLNGTYAENNKKYTWYTTGIKIEDIINIYGYTSLRDGSKYPIGNNVSDFSISIDSTSNIVVGLRSDLQVRTMVLYCIRIHKNIRLILQSLSKNKMIPIIKQIKNQINNNEKEQIKTAVKSMLFDSVGGDSTTGANITFNEMFPNLNPNQVICFNIEIVDVYETWDRVTAHILANGTLQIRSYLKTQQVSVRVTAFYRE